MLPQKGDIIMKEPKQNVLYKHEPINLNGKPLLVQNLWNFKLGLDGLMHNTKCKDFVLPWDEYEFTEIFDFEKIETISFACFWSTPLATTSLLQEVKFKSKNNVKINLANFKLNLFSYMCN